MQKLKSSPKLSLRWWRKQTRISFALALILLPLLVCAQVGQRAGRQAVTPDLGNFTFTCTAPGCVTRTAADKATDFINLKDFGCKCDGSTDDTNCFQLALNMPLPGNATARTINLPTNSVCLVRPQGGATGILTVQSNTVIRGQGDSSVVKVASNAGSYEYVFQIANTATNITFSDFRIDENCVANSGQRVQAPVYGFDGIAIGQNGGGTMANLRVQRMLFDEACGSWTFIISDGFGGQKIYYQDNIMNWRQGHLCEAVSASCASPAYGSSDNSPVYIDAQDVVVTGNKSYAIADTIALTVQRPWMAGQVLPSGFGIGTGAPLYESTCQTLPCTATQGEFILQCPSGCTTGTTVPTVSSTTCTASGSNPCSDGTTFAVTSCTSSGATATCTTAAHGLTGTQYIGLWNNTLGGVNTGNYNGSYSATFPSNTQIQFTLQFPLSALGTGSGGTFGFCGPFAGASGNSCVWRQSGGTFPMAPHGRNAYAVLTGPIMFANNYSFNFDRILDIVASTTPIGDRINNMVITNNTQDNGRRGISFWSADQIPFRNISIVGNVLANNNVDRRNDQTNSYCVGFFPLQIGGTGDQENITIANNQCKFQQDQFAPPYQYGISGGIVLGGDRVERNIIVKGNIITDPPSAGIIAPFSYGTTPGAPCPAPSSGGVCNAPYNPCNTQSLNYTTPIVSGSVSGTPLGNGNCVVTMTPTITPAQWGLAGGAACNNTNQSNVQVIVAGMSSGYYNGTFNSVWTSVTSNRLATICGSGATIQYDIPASACSGGVCTGCSTGASGGTMTVQTDWCGSQNVSIEGNIITNAGFDPSGSIRAAISAWPIGGATTFLRDMDIVNNKIQDLSTGATPFGSFSIFATNQNAPTTARLLTSSTTANDGVIWTLNPQLAGEIGNNIQLAVTNAAQACTSVATSSWPIVISIAGTTNAQLIAAAGSGACAAWFAGGTASIVASPNGASESGNTVTITTTTAHGFSIGQVVAVSSVGVSGYNGTFTINGVTSTTFSYYDPNTGLLNSGNGTAVVSAGLAVGPGTPGTDTAVTRAAAYFSGGVSTKINIKGNTSTSYCTTVGCGLSFIPEATNLAATRFGQWLPAPLLTGNIVVIPDYTADWTASINATTSTVVLPPNLLTNAPPGQQFRFKLINTNAAGQTPTFVFPYSGGGALKLQVTSQAPAAIPAATSRSYTFATDQAQVNVYQVAGLDSPN